MRYAKVADKLRRDPARPIHNPLARPRSKGDRWSKTKLPDGNARNDGQWYAEVLSGLRENPGCIGAHLCGAYYRNRVRRRGLLDENEQPDREMIELIRGANADAQAWVASFD